MAPAPFGPLAALDLEAGTDSETVDLLIVARGCVLRTSMRGQVTSRIAGYKWSDETRDLQVIAHSRI